MIARSTTLFAVLAAALATVAATGCDTEAFCFADCEGAVAGSAGTAGKGAIAGAAGAAGSLAIPGGGAAGTGVNLGGNAGTPGCVATTEVCDGKDNDCDGKIDNVDFTKPANCGNCETNCLAGPGALQGTTTPVCVPPTTPGQPGTCSYTACADEYYDLDGKKSNGCEFRCTSKTANDDKLCNNRDDDCDNQVDEDVDFCAAETCGACTPCQALNAVTTCAKADASKPTCKGNATCKIASCKPGFVDANNSYADGCELPCTPTANPAEVCDGVDNDCNGTIDDVGTNDPKVGKECFGDGVTPVIGECGAGTHAGAFACKGGKYTCEGPNVLLPGVAVEICDDKDNDCDGEVDESFPNAGAACGGVGNGQSLGLCKAGVLVCNNGSEVCSGTSGPQEELCNGQDDDCDDVIDGTVVGTPVDCTADATLCKPNETCQALSSNPAKKVCAQGAKTVGDACNNTFSPPPSGLVSACKAGVLACQGGVPVCVGSIEAPIGGVDACGIDVNCDGIASAGSQPNLQTDPNNCGQCGKQCGFVNNVAQLCVNGVCENDPNPQNCQPGFISCNGGKCNVACIKQSDQELCNNVDDDCDCRVDELAADTGDPKDISVPNPAASCGSSLGLDPECKSFDATTNPLGVVVSCDAGKFTCTFKNGFCSGGTCAGTADDCDTKDNNCNGVADEAYRNLGSQSLGTECASDDGKPFPGDGACRKKGTYVCDTAKTTKCSVKDAPFTCGTGPNGNGKACDEACDGEDNDCDGSIDEPKGTPGTNAAYFVKPAVAKVGNVYIQQYEASRPEATATSADSGNGFFSAAPAGVVPDRTYACSEAGVLPWFLVTPREVEQSCAAVGGRICRTNEWQAACRGNASCNWGYGTNCTTTGAAKCNLGVGADGYDNLTTTGALATSCFANIGAGSSVNDITGNVREITRCQADGASCGTTAQCTANCCSATSISSGGINICGGTGTRKLDGMPCTADDQCIDVPDDNGVPLTKDECRNGVAGAGHCQGVRGAGIACTSSAQCATGYQCIDSVCGGKDTIPGATYPVVGGAFTTSSEDGARCDFTFYKVSDTFKLYDTGFRCCYDSDPRLKQPFSRPEARSRRPLWGSPCSSPGGSLVGRRRPRRARPATRRTSSRRSIARPRSGRSRSTRRPRARSSKGSRSPTSRCSRIAIRRPTSSTRSTPRAGRAWSSASCCSAKATCSSSRCSTRPRAICGSCRRSRWCWPSR